MLLQRGQNCEDYITEGMMKKKKRETQKENTILKYTRMTHITFVLQLTGVWMSALAINSEKRQSSLENLSFN